MIRKTRAFFTFATIGFTTFWIGRSTNFVVRIGGRSFNIPKTTTKVSSPSSSEKETFERENPYVPYEAFTMQNDAKDCLGFPSTRKILFDNSFWQIAKLYSSTLYIYSAHYDERALQNGRKVHLLGETDWIINAWEIKCHFWFGSKSPPVVTEEVKVEYLDNSGWKDGKNDLPQFLHLFILSCTIPNDVKHDVPSSVSISDRNCKTLTNNIRVHSNPNKQKNGVAVCMKGMQYDKDITPMLIEWLEINRIFGAAKFSIYVYTLHDKTLKALEHYVKAGLVEILPITIPGPQPNTHLMRKQKFDGNGYAWAKEILVLNECYFRNMNSYKYVVVKDLDEIMVPRKHKTLFEMIQSMGGNHTTYSFADVYFWDKITKCQEGVPCNFHFLQRISRAPKQSEGQYKSVHDTDSVFMVKHHVHMDCLGKCSPINVPTDLALMQHYRATCAGPLREKCDSEYKNGCFDDKILWKQKDAIVSRVSSMLAFIGQTFVHRK